jgi:actin related protein 2/3 complex subunit 4
VERHNKPEVEMQDNKELLMTPVVIARDKGDLKVSERVLVEASVNSVRVSVNIKQADEIEEMLVRKFVSFLQQRAEHFFVLRRKPVPGYDISFLLTNFHCETMYKHKLVAFIIQFMNDVDADVKDLKTKINARARVAATKYLQAFV